MNEGICSLCEKAIEPGQEVLKQWWQEMETDELKEVKVHAFCGWRAIRDVLYLGMEQEQDQFTAEGRDAFPEQPLMGWEPRPFTPPWLEAEKRG